MKRKLFLAIIISGFSVQAIASFTDTVLTGTWKGTSICQIKSSPCHDEISVCHISKTGKEGIYRLIMNKMVNGVEEDMGVLDFTYDAAAGILTYKDEARNAEWKFTIKGRTIDGTAYVKGQLYRIIKLTKEK
jgi:hypothetical protein